MGDSCYNATSQMVKMLSCMGISPYSTSLYSLMRDLQYDVTNVGALYCHQTHLRQPPLVGYKVISQDR